MKRAGMIALPALALVCLATPALIQEANPFLAGSGPMEVRVNGIIGGGRLLGWSSTAQNEFLRDCVTAMPSLNARILPPEQQAILQTRCRNGAEDIVAHSPINAFAWSAMAELARFAQDYGAMNLALVNSQAIGPNELWIAERRVDTAEAAYDALSEPALAANRADLAVVASSPVAVRSIALRYIVQPAFRERITAIVETLPPAVQNRFLNNIRNAAQGGAGR